MPTPNETQKEQYQELITDVLNRYRRCLVENLHRTGDDLLIVGLICVDKEDTKHFVSLNEQAKDPECVRSLFLELLTGYNPEQEPNVINLDELN